MSGHRLVRITLITLVAGVITALVYLGDVRARHTAIERAASKWAKQIGTQAEGMVFEARKRRERDPVGWAVDLLAQGVEPRVMKVSRFRNEAMTETEYSELDPVQGVYNYYRIFFPEQGLGVHLEIQTPKPEFLGSQTQAANDFALVIFFLLCFLSTSSLYFIVRDWRGGQAEPTPYPASFETADETAEKLQQSEQKYLDLRTRVSEWVTQTRNTLTLTGATIRDLVKEAETLVKASARAYAQVGQLRDRVHEGISDTRGARAALQELESAMDVAEVLVLNLMLAAEKDANGSQLSSEELHRQLRQMRKLSAAAKRGLGIAEKKLEPVATDADIAFHALEETFAASSRMDGHISRTTQSLISQVRQVQDFRKRAAGEND